MKNIKSILVLLITVVVFTNCASVVEISDSWQGPEFNTLNNEKVLVINKANTKESRERFENDLADRLRKAGVNAVESYKVFPDMAPKKRTPEEIEGIKKTIRDAGYNGVVVSALKNKIEQSQTTRTGGYDKDMQTGEGMGVTIYNYNYHYYGFGSFYGSSYNSNLGSIYVEPETTTNSYNVYILETVSYNLSLEKEKELVGVLTVTVTDPTSYEEVADKYSRMIAKQFKK